MVKPTMKWWKVLIGFIIVFNVFLWLSGNLYLYKALLYNYVNIDDLDLFETRTVKAGQPEPWPAGSDYNKKPLTADLRKTLEEFQSVAFFGHTG